MQRDPGNQNKMTADELQPIILRLCKFDRDVQQGEKDEKYKNDVRKCVVGLIEELFQKSNSHSREELLKNYAREQEFLSQQIDERMHQVFTLGALFVPVSFLIFAQGVIYSSVPSSILLFVNKFLLMSASLICYVVWQFFYFRSRGLNTPSYPRIHAIEALLDISCHRYLRGPWARSHLMKLGPKIVKYAPLILFALWCLHIVSLYITQPPLPLSP